MTMFVIQLTEPWKRVSAEVLGQNRLGGKRQLIKEEWEKGNMNLIYIQPSHFQSKRFVKIRCERNIYHPKICVKQILEKIGTDFGDFF